MTCAALRRQRRTIRFLLIAAINFSFATFTQPNVASAASATLRSNLFTAATSATPSSPTAISTRLNLQNYFSLKNENFFIRGLWVTQPLSPNDRRFEPLATCVFTFRGRYGQFSAGKEIPRQLDIIFAEPTRLSGYTFFPEAIQHHHPAAPPSHFTTASRIRLSQYAATGTPQTWYTGKTLSFSYITPLLAEAYRLGFSYGGNLFHPHQTLYRTYWRDHDRKAIGQLTFRGAKAIGDGADITLGAAIEFSQKSKKKTHCTSSNCLAATTSPNPAASPSLLNPMVLEPDDRLLLKQSLLWRQRGKQLFATMGLGKSIKSSGVGIGYRIGPFQISGKHLWARIAGTTTISLPAATYTIPSTTPPPTSPTQHRPLQRSIMVKRLSLVASYNLLSSFSGSVGGSDSGSSSSIANNSSHHSSSRRSHLSTDDHSHSRFDRWQPAQSTAFLEYMLLRHSASSRGEHGIALGAEIGF